ncbi:MAG TPA: Mu-like prophage major head subunit gpT family protein, partial [Gemmataceae bacterium]|nr:Mu-like prophage major head subunit gpT family protein [Gemmataceae bacterium]
MLTDRIDLFTQALNTAFINAYDQIPEQAPIDEAITVVGSKGRIENYPWLFPPPFLHQWQGYRQYATLGETNYRVPNITYTAEFQCLLEDLEDDQVGGFKLQAAAMARGAQEWKGIQSLINLANGQTVTCFDGSNFFATSHTVGTGNNIVAGTAAGSDGVTHAMVCMVTKNKVVKPLLWQIREGPNFKTDAGSLEADKIRNVSWWSDLRGAAAFGFWWDCVLVKWSNTPTLAEVQTTIGTVNARFRQFTYPKNLPSDPNMYPHGQTTFTDKTVTIVCSSLIDHLVRQALTLSLIATTDNPWKSWAKQIT